MWKQSEQRERPVLGGRLVLDTTRLKRVAVLTYFGVYAVLLFGARGYLNGLFAVFPTAVQPPPLAPLHESLGLPRSVALSLFSLSVTLVVLGFVVLEAAVGQVDEWPTPRAAVAAFRRAVEEADTVPTAKSDGGSEPPADGSAGDPQAGHADGPIPAVTRVEEPALIPAVTRVDEAEEPTPATVAPAAPAEGAAADGATAAGTDAVDAEATPDAATNGEASAESAPGEGTADGAATGTAEAPAADGPTDADADGEDAPAESDEETPGETDEEPPAETDEETPATLEDTAGDRAEESAADGDVPPLHPADEGPAGVIVGPLADEVDAWEAERAADESAADDAAADESDAEADEETGADDPDAEGDWPGNWQPASESSEE